MTREPLFPFLRWSPAGRVLLFFLAAGFVLLRWGEAIDRLPAWARNHGDDLLCLPLVLGLALAARRAVRRSSLVTLPLSHGLLAVPAYSLYFEVILPRTGHPAVADPLDALMYLAGFLVFQFGLNRPVAEPDDRADILPVNWWEPRPHP